MLGDRLRTRWSIWAEEDIDQFYSDWDNDKCFTVRSVDIESSVVYAVKGDELHGL
jgi:hypothetical protein